MTWFERLRRRFGALFHKPQIEHELDDELRFHLEMEERLHRERGLSPEAARTEALRRFGGVEKVKEECRDERGVSWIEHALQDLRYGLRSLVKTPGFMLVVLLTLALGIGANSALFSVIHGVLLRPLPYGESERLVHVRQHAPGVGAERMGFSAKEIRDLREGVGAFDQVAEYHGMSFTLLGEEPVRVETGVVSANFFDLLGIEPLHGRTFQEQDDRQGAEAVLILGHGFWQRQFGGDPKIVGTALEMNDKMHTVIGVLPPVPLYPQEQDVYMPTAACEIRTDEAVIANREHRMMSVFARLQHGTDLAEVRPEVAAWADRIGRHHPEIYPPESGYSASIAPLKDEIVDRAHAMLWILFGTVALVLLIACFNVANLMLARQLRRERELLVRAALGAGRGRLIRQLLTESTLLALAGGAIGLMLAHLALPLLLRLTDNFLPRVDEVGIDPPVLLFTLGVSLLTGLFFGALPAFASRRDLAAALRSESGQTTESAGRQRLRQGLLVAQLAVSFVLLAGAGLLVRSLSNLQQVDSGFQAEHVMSMMVSPNWTKYPRGEAAPRRELFGNLLERIERHPAVRSAAVASTFPLYNWGPTNLEFDLEKQPVGPGEPKPRTNWNVVSESYFQTLGIPLLQGRGFTDRDREDAPSVAIVDRSFARRYWGDRDPVGERLLVEASDEVVPVEIVGVVGDTRLGLARDAEPTLYIPFRQRAESVWRLVVRTRDDPGALMTEIRSLIWEVEPEQPVAQEQTLTELRQQHLEGPRRNSLLFGLFAGLALLITATGIGGVIAFSVGQRTHEIGIRMALGAARLEVLSMVLSQALRLVAYGLVIGVLIAFFAAPPLADLLYGVTPHDALTFVAVALALAAVAALAAWLPARRATRIHPMTALRTD